MPAALGVRGAVDLEECPTRHCRCGPCAVCGHQKHTGIHGPYFGRPPGSRPWGHEFVPAPVAHS